MALHESAHDGWDAAEARLSAFAEALSERQTELLCAEVERIRGEAADQLAEQCRLLAALSMSVARAEAARERRVKALETELREIEQAAPKPLQVPRRSQGDPGSASVSDLWSGRRPGS